MLVFAYVQGILFLPLIYFSDYFVSSTLYLYNSIYYHKATWLFNIWGLIFLWIAGSSFYELFEFIKITKGVEKIRALYLFWGMALGWVGGITTLLPPFNIKPIYPAWHFTICFYAVLMTYAVFKYQLLDIKIAVTRVGIFILVYTLILGIPYGFTYWGKDYLLNILGSNWYWIPLIVTTIFATVGPFLYLYIQRKAEDRLLKEQRRYQATLRQASTSMGQIKEMKRLARLLVYIVTRAVRLEHASVYIDDVRHNGFSLGAVRNRPEAMHRNRMIAGDSSLVSYLKEYKKPIVYEEIKRRVQNYADHHLVKIHAALEELDAALIMPNFIEDRLLGIFVLSRKRSGKFFSEDDLAAFSILANQAALAMENIKSAEEMKKAQEKLFHAEKLAYVGQLASSVVHEVRNPLTAIKTFVGYLPEKFRAQDFDFLERFEAVIPREINRIEKMVRELLDLAKPRQTSKNEMRSSVIVGTTLELLKDNFQLKKIRVQNECLAEDDRILCDAEQIQQVMLNLILNALDAMKDGGQLSVKIWREDRGRDRIMIAVRDTGCGISKEELKELFTPFHTTKKNGVGLGLIITQEIVKMHGGEIHVESEPDQGTQFTIVLPAI